jgi:esterase/lipase superfamily enzyme
MHLLVGLQPDSSISRPASLLLYRPDRPRRIESERAGDMQELDDVDAAFAAFVFRDETLVFTQFVGEGLLGKPSSLAGIDQVLGQAHMFSRAQGLQGGGLRVRARICNPALPISQFRIRFGRLKPLA